MKNMKELRQKLCEDNIQGGFFNWDPPKNHKYWKQLKYPNWDPPKNHKYGKKFKYPNWDPPKISKCGKKFKYRTKRIMFVFRVQQTAMVCEHTMEQQSFLIQSMPSVDFIHLKQGQYSIVY